jgi:S-methylmethionine-dependent homocysteine/selenocysteine methylase
MNYTEAFAKYGAKLKNPQWSVSAIAADGSLVVSLYSNWFKKGILPKTLTYSDKLSSWKGNVPGRNEFSGHLEDAKRKNVAVRIVIATPEQDQAHLVGQVADESEIKKTFSVRTDWIGSLEVFDGDEYKFLIKQAS